MTQFDTFDDLIAHEKRRGNTYKLLAESYQIPDEERLELLRSVEDDPETPIAVEGLADALGADLETYKIDHSKLFVGPFELIAPPYGSRYLEGKEHVMTESTMDVRDWYQREGFSMSLREPDDHVAGELEFLYALTVEELNALTETDPERAVTYLERQHDFLNAHLGRWVEPFAENIVEHAETELYRTLGEETSRFVREDLEWLSELFEDGADSVVESLAEPLDAR